MKRLSWEFRLGLTLIALFLVLSAIHYAIFRDGKHLLFWDLTDLAFLPISVLFVSLIIERLQIAREARLRLKKINMLVGTFFDSAGRQLLTRFTGWDPRAPNLREEIRKDETWTAARCRALRATLEAHEYGVDLARVDLPELRSFLGSRMDVMLRLLENPFLLEHEAFADALRAVFHLAEELSARDRLDRLPDADAQHLAGDIRRAYGALAVQWLDYMRYLQRSYPYLFSLAMRMNPFDPQASPVVKA